MTWRELPKKLRLYIAGVACLAVPLVIWAIWDLAHREVHPGWIVLTLLTVVTVPSFWFLPSVNTIVGIGDAYVMAIAMIYGPSACVIATVGHSLSASLFVPRPKVYPYRVIFNVSSTVCIAWVYSNIYRTINPTLSHSVDVLVLPVVVLTLCFFLLNSLSTATAISWASGEKIAGFWTRYCMPLAMEFSVSAVCASLIVGLKGYSDWAPLAAAPLIGLAWGWNKLNKAKAMEAEQHLKEQEELYLRTVESLGLAVDAKDQTTYGHIHRVRAYAMGLAGFCGIKDKNELMAIETGSLLHDIGKLAIDDYILNKPGKLSKQEFEKMKMHAPAGHEILEFQRRAGVDDRLPVGGNPSADALAQADRHALHEIGELSTGKGRLQVVLPVVYEECNGGKRHESSNSARHDRQSVRKVKISSETVAELEKRDELRGGRRGK